MDNLKNNDFAKASVLLKAAEQNNCKAFLCLVSYIEESYGECGYGGGWDDEDEENFTEYEVSFQEIYAHHFISTPTEKTSIQKITLQEDELLTKIHLVGGPGREVSISEATGNEGATKDLWYHRGAIIIWPEHRAFDFITKTDLAYVILSFKNLSQYHDVSQGEDRKKAIFLAHHILDHQKSKLLQPSFKKFHSCPSKQTRYRIMDKFS